jgi:probable phosphoglycerate mutase
VRLILVRHGDAHAGFHGVIGGHLGCTGLTPLGRSQAEALRDHLAASGRVQADVLLASALPRAIETATIIGPGLGLEIAGHDCDLCEVHTGEADGLTWAEYSARFGTFDMVAEPDRPFAPGGDSWNGFHERVHRTLDRLAREHEGQTVVAVCHAGVIMAAMRLLLGMPRPGAAASVSVGVGTATGATGTAGNGTAGAELRPTNTGLTEWEHDEALDRWLLHSFNETAHLLRLATTA